MIQSLTAPDTRWIAVPAGLHVAWRDVDLTMFAHRSRLVAGVEAMRQATSGAIDAARTGYAVMQWRAIDRFRRTRGRLRQRSAYAWAIGRRIIRLGPPQAAPRRWNLTVRISYGHGDGPATRRSVA